jgi:hypothetical protein
MSDKIDLGPTHMNLQPALHYSRKNLPKIKPFLFTSKKSLKKVKSIKHEKPVKNRSSCVYNEGTNRCKYGSPHDGEKCVLNVNVHCERRTTNAKAANVSIKKARKPRCKNGTRRNQQGECVPK